MKHTLACLLCAMALLFSVPVWGQARHTFVSGTVTDAQSGEPMAFVQVMVKNSTHGTVTDINGHFDLTTGADDTVVTFRMVGYAPQEVIVGKRSSTKMRVRLAPTTQMLETVTITAKRSKGDRYKRKDNPAVELMKQVIANKDSNTLRSVDTYSREVYEKLNLCLDQFHPDFGKHRFWKHFPFVEKYIDRADFDGAEILHISIREKMSTEEYRNHRRRTLVTVQRTEGVDQNLDDEGLDDDMGLMFAQCDIFDNEIDLMSVRFVSPFSSTLGNSFYHYYITDTVEVDGEACVELSFIPSSKGNFGFVGMAYVTADSLHSVKRYNMRVPDAVDINFVRDLTVIQEFERDSTGRLLPSVSDTYCRFQIGRRRRLAYAHKKLVYHDYALGQNAASLPDSLFKAMASSAEMPGARKVRRRVWNATRPVNLSLAETFLDSMRYEMMRIPIIRHTVHTGEVLLTGYIPTSADRDSSKFDIGSIYNFVSHNGNEGLRLRLGGMTTSRLSNRNFASGYVAYGIDDRQPKFGLTLIHTFDPKRRWPTEHPLGLISLNLGYDIESPGLTFEQFDRDNIMMWTDIETPAQYVADAQLRLRKQWPNHIGIDTWVGAQHITPTGMLNYQRIIAGGTERVDEILHAQWAGRVTYSTLAKTGSTRTGEGSLLNLSGNSAIVTLGHEMGILDGFPYHRTTASMVSKLWLAAFGYLDLRLQGGWVWNQVPMPKLFTPSGNISPLIADAAFNTMQPMEFMADRYAALFATYHMKGLVLNHLPIIKRLRLREVLSFNMLYGSLSDKNVPSAEHLGLYLLPTYTKPLSATPYAEFGVGIENIFKVVRIDYIRRLTHLDSIDQPWMVKVGLRFTI